MINITESSVTAPLLKNYPQRKQANGLRKYSLKEKTALIPYTKTISEKVGRISKQHKMKCTHIPINKISGVNGSEKDKIPLKCHGLSCQECKMIYIGQLEL